MSREKEKELDENIQRLEKEVSELQGGYQKTCNLFWEIAVKNYTYSFDIILWNSKDNKLGPIAHFVFWDFGPNQLVKCSYA